MSYQLVSIQGIIFALKSQERSKQDRSNVQIIAANSNLDGLAINWNYRRFEWKFNTRTFKLIGNLGQIAILGLFVPLRAPSYCLASDAAHPF